MIKVAMLWLADKEGKLLLARRADHKAQDPGLWGPSVTGKVEVGETFEEAVIREADEELQLKETGYVPQFLFDTDFQHPDGEVRRFRVFAASLNDDVISTLKFDPNEVAEISWLPIHDIKQLLHAKPSTKVVASAFVLWDQIFAMLEQQKIAS